MEEEAKKRQKELAEQAEPVAGDVENQIAASSTTASVRRHKSTRRKMRSDPIRGSGHFFGAAEPASNGEENLKAAFEGFVRQHNFT